MFDPYGDWLGISREQRPINCFVLLGIEPDVKDPEAIRAAAADQAGRVKKHEKGPHAQAAARLLKEIDLAKATLLDPARRKAYLARLRNKNAVAKEAATEPEVEVVAEPEVEVVAEEEPEVEVVVEPEVEVEVEPEAEVEAEVEAEPEEEAAAEEKEDAPAKAKGKAKGKSKKKAGGKAAKKEAAAGGSRKWLWISLGGAAAMLLLGGGLTWYLLSGTKKTDSPAKTDSVAKNGPPGPGGMMPPGMMPPGMKRPGGPMPPNDTPPPPKEEPKIQPMEDPKTPPPQEEANTPPPPPPPPPPAPTRPPDPRPAKVAKLPVPDSAAQDRAEKALKDKYKDDYARLGNKYKEEPKRKTEELLALAAKLLQPGREDRNDPAGWFVLLREARDLAVLAGRPRLAAEAVHEIDQWFLIDAPAMKVEALNAILASANPATAAVAVQVALAQVAPAVAEDNYDGALKLIAVAEAAVLKTKPNDKGKPDEKLESLVQARKSQVETWQKAFASVAEAKKKLAAAPDDEAANLAVGRHLCFFQGEWNDGLPLLAKGSDAQLKDLAQKDLARPGDAAGQIAVGDGWWKLAELQSDRTKAHVRERAAYWYESAEPSAMPEDQVKVEQRINETLAAALKPSRYLPGSFFARSLEDRILLLREGGGNMRTEEAIEKGLEWLAQHQFQNGHWATDANPATSKCNCTECSEKKHDVGATALGILPFLGVGQTHLKGRHAAVVQRGLNYLKKQQKPEGHFSDSMYENALATIALCEAYGLSGDKTLQGQATRAAAYIAAAQNSQGGWGYTPGNPKADTSVTGWQFSALKTAYYAGIKAQPATFDRVQDFLDLLADPAGMGYGYNDTTDIKLSTTAAGLLCREYLGWGPRHPKMKKPLQRLLGPAGFVTKDAPNIYYLFYATQVMHHAGGKSWEGWNPKTRDLLLELQDQGTDGGHDHQKGSWSPRGDTYATEGGRLLFTSLALLTLEVYYYHVPLYGYGPALVQEE